MWWRAKCKLARLAAPLPGSWEGVWGPHGLHVLPTDCAVRALHPTPSSRALGVDRRASGFSEHRTGEGKDNSSYCSRIPSDQDSKRGTRVLTEHRLDSSWFSLQGFLFSSFTPSFGKHHASHFGYFTSVSTGAKGESDDGTGEDLA